MDGVLADTEGINADVAEMVCRHLRIRLTKKERLSCVGVTSEKFYSDLFKNRQIKMELAPILKKHNRLYQSKLSKNIYPLPGAKTVPKLLKRQGFKIVLVTGSTKKQTDIVLKKLNLQKTFDLIVTAENTSKSKPDPHGFLLAAKKLKVKPQNWLVLEDSAPGIKQPKARV